MLSSVGIIGLLIFASFFEPTPIEIEEIFSEKPVGKKVMVSGRIEWSSSKEKFVLFELNDGNKIDVVFFNPTDEEKKFLKSRAFVEVLGEVRLYKNKLEIVAEKVKQID